MADSGLLKQIAVVDGVLTKNAKFAESGPPIESIVKPRSNSLMGRGAIALNPRPGIEAIRQSGVLGRGEGERAPGALGKPQTHISSWGSKRGPGHQHL